jgi:F-type H+-transporting ATPase subunit gamma
MAGAKEIRSKIASIKSTQKITRAMQMVAASKMRKTQDRMRASRPYAQKIYDVIKNIGRSSSEYKHSFMLKRDVKRVGVIVVTSDKGLCGGLNVNLLRELMVHAKQWQLEGKELAFCVLGRKGHSYFKRHGGNVLAVAEDLTDLPSMQSLIGPVKVMVDAFNTQAIDALHVVYNEFVNTMVQEPKIQQLLPLPQDEFTDAEVSKHHWDYIYEPDAKFLLDLLLNRYLELQVYQAVVENIACEQAAKMLAMKNATDNAGELIKTFQLAYNKARQALITQELAEIVGGADAL